MRTLLTYVLAALAAILAGALVLAGGAMLQSAQYNFDWTSAGYFEALVLTNLFGFANSNWLLGLATLLGSCGGFVIIKLRAPKPITAGIAA